jgi:sterol desaturase/sphingolipid hydroxylase (fatty acid hydroxylase superfamily)
MRGMEFAALLPHGPFWDALFVGVVIYGGRYLLFSGIAFAVWYARGPRGKLQPAMPRGAQIRREIAYSLGAVLIFGVVHAVLFDYGIGTRLYWDIGRYGWTYFWLSIPLMIVLHDAYFYWTHRLMHTRALFRSVHGVHHLSRSPTPWTSYAFHPNESLVQALGIVLILYIVPSHPLAILVFQTCIIVIAIYHHLGYEICPQDWPRHWLGRWVTTSVAHNAHHEKARHNYGFYFLLWDRWMGTLDPDYEAHFNEKVAAGALPNRAV